MFAGVRFEKEEDIKFNSLQVRYSQLDDWVETSDFTFEGGREELVVRYRRPKDIRMLTNDELTLLIWFQSSYSLNSAAREPEITERQWLVINSHKIMHIEKYMQVMRQLEVFFSLMIGRPVHPLEIKGLTKYAKTEIGDYTSFEDIGVFYQLANTLTQQNSTFLEPLVRYQDIKDRFENIISNWFAKAGELEPIYELYFVSVHGRQMYLEQKFLCLIQALESYHRTMVGNRELPEEEHSQRIQEIMETVPERHKAWLKDKLSYSNEPTLRTRLKGLLIQDEFQPTASHLIKGSKNFITKVCNTRNYLTHHEPELSNACASGEALYRVTLQLMVLVEMCLLKEVGLAADEIHKSISAKYDRYKTLRDTK